MSTASHVLSRLGNPQLLSRHLLPFNLALANTTTQLDPILTIMFTSLQALVDQRRPISLMNLFIEIDLDIPTVFRKHFVGGDDTRCGGYLWVIGFDGWVQPDLVLGHGIHEHVGGRDERVEKPGDVADHADSKAFLREAKRRFVRKRSSV